jgi:hypothetical protein
MSLSVGGAQQSQATQRISEPARPSPTQQTERASEAIQAKRPASQEAVDGARTLNQGIEQQLQQRLQNQVPGENGQQPGGNDGQDGGQLEARRRVRCGRGGRCYAESSPVRGLGSNIA